MITFCEGNILDAKENIICHQVNCQGVMGGGLAKQIRDKWPHVYDTYRDYIKFGKSQLLGCINVVSISETQCICNIFGQNNYGIDKRCTSYDALYEAFSKLEAFAGSALSIAIPFGLGCGLGGGDWDIVHFMINYLLHDCDVTIYKWVG